LKQLKTEHDILDGKAEREDIVILIYSYEYTVSNFHLFIRRLILISILEKYFCSNNLAIDTIHIINENNRYWRNYDTDF